MKDHERIISQQVFQYVLIKLVRSICCPCRSRSIFWGRLILGLYKRRIGSRNFGAEDLWGATAESHGGRLVEERQLFREEIWRWAELIFCHEKGESLWLVLIPTRWWSCRSVGGKIWGTSWHLQIHVVSWAAQNHKEQSWSVEAGLAHAAEYLRLPHYSHIGVYVQREHLQTLGSDWGKKNLFLTSGWKIGWGSSFSNCFHKSEQKKQRWYLSCLWFFTLSCRRLNQSELLFRAQLRTRTAGKFLGRLCWSTPSRGGKLLINTLTRSSRRRHLQVASRILP